MKVLLVNGSPKAQGCTYTALSEIRKELEVANVETELIQVGVNPIRGCTKCVFPDGPVNELIEKAKHADGFIFGSPVHYAAASGQLTSLLDRAFYAGKSVFRYKPGAAIVSCRRGGATAAFEQLNKYFTISNMPVVSSQYWNMVHGNTPEEVQQDLEGMQTMRLLGKNMAWLLHSLQAGKAAGIELPEQEPREITNFIR
jgi:multimeric flavodoxin WrbA